LYQKVRTAGGHVLRELALLAPRSRKHHIVATVQAWK
jgi:hypothetical protein